MNSETPPGLKLHTRAKQDTAHGIRTLARYLQKRADEREIEQCRLLMVKLAQDRFSLEYARTGPDGLRESLADFAAAQKSGALLVWVAEQALVLVERASCRLRFLKMAGEIPRAEIGKRRAALVERYRLLREARRKSFIGACERILSFEKERMSSSADRFAAEETGALSEELHEIFSLSSRAPVFRALRRFGRHASARIAEDICSWAEQQVRRLNFELIDILRHEWVRIEQELDSMAVCADELLEAARCFDFPFSESFEPPVHEVLMAPTKSKIEWRPGAQPALAFLPVRIARTRAEKRLLEQMRRFIAASTRRAEEKLLGEVRCALDTLGFEMEERAAAAEAGALDAFEKKRPLRGNDGRLRATRFEVEKIASEMVVLAGIEKRLGSIRLQLLEAESCRGGPEIPPDCCSTPADDDWFEEPAERQTALGVKDGPEFKADLKTRGCAVCNSMNDATARFLADRQYAVSVRETARREFADSVGFCSFHMWQLEALSSPHGLSFGLSTLMDKLSTDLAQLACSKESSPEDFVLKLVQHSRDCAVCRLLQEVEDIYLDNLARFLQIIEGRETYAHSQGVCLRHLGMLIAKTEDKGTVKFLLDHASRLFRQLSEDMLNYALKRDGLRADLLDPDEKDAYLRALIHTAGAKRIRTPRQM